MAFANKRVAKIKIGIGIKVNKLKRQSTQNIKLKIAMSESISPNISINPAENTSEIDSTSDTTRVTKEPTGVWSKYRVLKDKTVLNTLVLRSLMTDCAKRFDRYAEAQITYLC